LDCDHSTFPPFGTLFIPTPLSTIAAMIARL